MEQVLALPGLDAPAEIRVDRWGIPHLRAASTDDLWFLQGFNAARDRLWQLDLWRKRGLGLLSAELGPGYLAQDRAARLFLYRSDMEAEWAAYGPDSRAICARFVAGLNAYVALCEQDPARLPPEFALAGMHPAQWEVEDLVRIRTHGLVRNALQEVARARVLSSAGAAAETLRKPANPPHAFAAAEGLDLASIPLAVLDVFRLATAPVAITPERLRATLAEAAAWSKVTELGEVLRDAEWQGSNNWVVHGSRTETGRPVLANDPHRAHAVPPLRYLVHLTAPGFDAVGAGEPHMPGISLGHNGTIAFGLTIFGADQEDIYVYDTHPEDPDLYRYAEGWERMRRVEETIGVRGEAEQAATLRFTRHGPVLFEDRAARRAYALRSAWAEPGSAPYFASLAAMRARSLPEYRAAIRGWGTPSVNQVYADTSGTIAWLPVGFMPRRPNWDGMLPVPGDGRFEWDGTIGPETLPCLVNPPQGFVATANEMNLPQDWDHARHGVGFDWTESARAQRIQEVMRSEAQHSVSAACALQTDVVSVPARRIAALAARLDTPAAVLFQGWDGALRGNSAAAALFEMWFARHLKPALYDRVAGGTAACALMPPGDSDAILAALEAPPAWLPDRDALLRATLEAAWAECAARLGPDPASWRWDRLHHGYFEHPLSRVTSRFDVGPLPVGGSAQSPMHTGYRGDWRAILGASVRMVVDVGAWDDSRCINAPGQSGDPRSPHYADLAERWARGEYVPMLYSREAVDAATTFRIRLEPAR
jgi:penicillin amidase